MLDFLRRQIEEKRYLDTVFHVLIATILCIFFSQLFKNYERTTIIIFVFAGSFFPDIDHLLLYKKSRFYNFKSFLRWLIHSNRYRIGFELFHNFPSIVLISLLLPLLYLRNKLMFMFFVAFLFHLLLDLVLDKLVIRRIKFWRFGV